MSGAKEAPHKQANDDVDPFLETVVRGAADRAPEPKVAARSPGRTSASQVGATKSAVVTHPKQKAKNEASPEGDEPSHDDDARLMDRVEAKLKSSKVGMSRSVTVRMPIELYEQLTDKAWKIGERSLSRFVITVLQEASKEA